MKAGIIGGSGYTGVELLRLLAGHPDIEVATVTAHARAGQLVGEYTSSLAAAYPGMVYEAADPDTLKGPNSLDGLDLVFCALPHGESQRIVPALRERVGVIVDLAADFRLRDPALYPTWYGESHEAPALLDQAVYGLPELFRQPLEGATLIASAGCYPTAAGLALAPLVRAGLVEPNGIIVNAASGTSGAGRAATDALHFGTVDENFVAYGLLTHRHTPEIQQILGAEVLFTPHLAPMVRGILTTCYARPAPLADGARALTTADVMGALHAAYDHEPFVVVTDAPPSTKATSGSNCAHVTARVDERTGWVLALCALDNLIKGAAGQAVQCANVALGLPETTGLPTAGLYP
jgi:N-acetyl-gamma-glutamyl-phosphate reductase